MNATSTLNPIGMGTMFVLGSTAGMGLTAISLSFLNDEKSELKELKNKKEKILKK